MSDSVITEQDEDGEWVPVDRDDEDAAFDEALDAVDAARRARRAMDDPKLN
jgi:hypothetical protein